MMGTAGKPISTAAALEAWQSHRHFKYRACAPDPSNPRVLAARPDLSVDTHMPADRDGAEPQADRVAREAAAVELCLGCPVMVLCDAYANSLTPEGKLAEPDGVWGGRRALERHKALIAARHAVAAAPDHRFQTAQKRAVLRALARFWDPFDVAAWAGVDVRTANWQRSSLVRLLGLPKDVSRMRALAVARERGLLEGVEVVADDGSVPAVPPPTKLPASPSPRSVALFQPAPGLVETALEGVCRVVRPRRRRVVAVPAGQLPLFDDSLAPAAAPVVSLFRTVPLGAAA